MGPMFRGLLFLLILYVGSRFWALHRNYRAAKSIDLPIIVCPFDPDGLFHQIFSVPFRPFFRFILPASLFNNIELSIWGWEFRDKAAIHERLGPAFIFVSTGLNRLICADPLMARSILARRRDFVHPDITLKAMGFLGPNIVTVSDDSWSRHRRILASALNERISSNVWKESVEQAFGLTEVLTSPSTSSSVSEAAPTIVGLRAIAMNVLAHIAYGHQKPFAIPSPTGPSKAMSYVDAISVCTELLVVAAFLPAWLLRLPFMPQTLQTLGVALEKLPGLTRDLLENQRRNGSSTVPAAGGMETNNSNELPNTIISTLVDLPGQPGQGKARAGHHSSDVSQKKEQISSSNSNNSHLTKDEIAGNLFIFTAAGFDTTANTMSYAVTLLAAYPKWQSWIRTEIDTVLGSPLKLQKGCLPLPDYAATFPKLTRCMALMLETLRLFPPVTLLMRSNSATRAVQSIDSAESNFLVPSPCAVYVNTVALHTCPSVWGEDALDFNPARWVRPGSGEEAEYELMTPPRGTFIPWSIGPRTCPGQKMSQVEFVAVIATLFHACTVEPITKNGESIEQARDKLLDLMQDSQPVLTLQMNRPSDVQLKWKRR